MKQHNKTGTVAYATSSGFAVVYGPKPSASEAPAESSKSKASVAKVADKRPSTGKSAPAS